MDQDHYIKLIHQDLRGELTEDGRQQLTIWRQADPEHPVLEREIRKAWTLSGAYEPELTLDVSAAYNSLRTRVRAQEKEAGTATVRRLRPQRWIAVAASLLLLLCAGWLLWPTAEPNYLSVRTASSDAPREVVLPDGSRVWLRAESELSYPAAFAQNERPVQVRGEAFFVVEHQPQAPFRVRVDEALEVSVKGTAFLIDAADTNTIEVLVRDGRVTVSPLNDAREILLEKGDGSRYQRSNGRLDTIAISPNAAAWRNGTLSFRQETLRGVIDDLETHFSQTITLRNQELAECRFSGRFPDARLPEVLDALRDAFALNWEKNDTAYLLTDGSCR